MTSKEKELLNAINGTERMSGFDSYDDGMSYFDDYDDFDGDDMSYFDGDDMSYASGGSKPRSVSDPYVIQYTNNDIVPVTAFLFGYNDFFSTPNFGNPALTTITNLQTGGFGGYVRLIAQTQNKQFKIGKWRFQCTTPAQLQVTLNITHVDANGKQFTTPLNLSIMRDAYQQQSDIIDVNKTVTVDGNTFISFTLLPTTFTISMFPVELISAKAKLNGGSAINSAKAPRLSGKNVSPVVIQTTQNVKGVAKS